MWVIKYQMGLHQLWMAEFLVQPLNLKPGMRVLDLGCGKGVTSAFLAKEFGIQVYAADFDEWEGWTSTELRRNNAKERGVGDINSYNRLIICKYLSFSSYCNDSKPCRS